MLGLGLALLAEYMDDSWRSPEEVEQITGVPTFGAVPEFRFIEDKSKKG
jgi:capsular polysaccharide biosynthesis protein